MRGVFSMLFLLTLMVLSSHAKKEKGKGSKGASDCGFANCVARNSQCPGVVSEGSCADADGKSKCKVPCNWRRPYGPDCKYKFDNWVECKALDGKAGRRGVMRGTGTLKQARSSEAGCLATVDAIKPCKPKTIRPKGQKKEG